MLMSISIRILKLSRLLNAYGAKVTLKKEGRRWYFEGNSYPIKDEIKSVKGKWDRDRKQWWISSIMYARHKDFVDGLLGEPINYATHKQQVYIEKLYDALDIRPETPVNKILFSDAGSIINNLKAQLKKVQRDQPSKGSGPSRKQIDYALRLIDRIGPHGWHDSDVGQDMQRPPNRKELETWSAREVSEMIDDIRQ